MRTLTVVVIALVCLLITGPVQANPRNTFWGISDRDKFVGTYHEIDNLAGYVETIGRTGLTTHPTQHTLPDPTPEIAPVLATARSGPMLALLFSNDEGNEGSTSPRIRNFRMTREMFKLPRF